MCMEGEGDVSAMKEDGEPRKKTDVAVGDVIGAVAELCTAVRESKEPTS